MRSLFLLLALLAGCSRPEIKGDGVVKTEDRPVSGFSSVSAKGGYRIQWSNGKPALTISADENLLPLIKTTVAGGVLRVTSEQPLAPSREIVISLAGGELSAVHLDGRIHFKAETISGRKFELSAFGASDVGISGAVNQLDVSLTGASHLDAKSLHAENAAMSLVGASDAHVFVSETLEVSITGAGFVDYRGSPKTVERKILGAGRVQGD